jgi:hypothetical protein
MSLPMVLISGFHMWILRHGLKYSHFWCASFARSAVADNVVLVSGNPGIEMRGLDAQKVPEAECVGPQQCVAMPQVGGIGIDKTLRDLAGRFPGALLDGSSRFAEIRSSRQKSRGFRVNNDIHQETFDPTFAGPLIGQII